MAQNSFLGYVPGPRAVPVSLQPNTQLILGSKDVTLLIFRFMIEAWVRECEESRLLCSFYHPWVISEAKKHPEKIEEIVQRVMADYAKPIQAEYLKNMPSLQRFAAITNVGSARMRLLTVCKCWTDLCLTFIFPPWKDPFIQPPKDQLLEFKIHRQIDPDDPDEDDLDDPDGLGYVLPADNPPPVARLLLAEPPTKPTADGESPSTVEPPKINPKCGLIHAIKHNHAAYYVKWSRVANATRWDPSAHHGAIFLHACAIGCGTIITEMFEDERLDPRLAQDRNQHTKYSVRDYIRGLREVNPAIKQTPREETSWDKLPQYLQKALSRSDPTAVAAILRRSIFDDRVAPAVRLIDNEILFKLFNKFYIGTVVFLLQVSDGRVQFELGPTNPANPANVVYNCGLQLDPSHTENRILARMVDAGRTDVVKFLLSDARVRSAKISHVLGVILPSEHQPTTRHTNAHA
jgi:hypothetical protein